MSLPIWQATITNANGDVTPGAEIEVIDEATGLAPAGGLFSNRAGTFELTNPFFADSNGFASFYAAPGEYSISATDVGTSENRTWRFVILGGSASIKSENDFAKENDLMGVNQSWQNVTSDRSPEVNYTNSTGKPIMVAVRFGGTVFESQAPGGITVDGIGVYDGSTTNATSNHTGIVLVPVGSTYRVSTGADTSYQWRELR